MGYYTISQSGMSELFNDKNEPVQRTLYFAAARASAVAKANVGKKYAVARAFDNATGGRVRPAGELAKSISINAVKRGPFTDEYAHTYYQVGSDKKYALAHHTGGFRFYEIRPHNKRGALRFPARGGGKIFYSTLVHHPPNKPNDYLRKALESVGTISRLS